MPLLLLQSDISNALDYGEVLIASFLDLKKKRLLITKFYFLNFNIIVLEA